MLNNEVQKKFQNLEQTRDEIKLQAHLFAAEAKQKWENLEEKWEQALSEVRPAVQAAGTAASNLGEAQSLLIEELVKGYRDIKSKL